MGTAIPRHASTYASIPLRGGNCLHVNGGPIYIKKGTRVGQFVIWKVANAQGAYQGDYGMNADGTPKEMETKYHA